jgi:glycerophosphoryl diester phosphodiesterase
MTKPLNIAHRGGAGLWPENTLFALGEAARAGFDGAEIDVQLTRDGKLAVFHDFRLKSELCRDAAGHWLRHTRRNPLPLIRDLTYADLSHIAVGRVRRGTAYSFIRAPRHPRDGERIPLLSEVIATVRAVRRRFKLFIEIKTSYEDRALSAGPEAVAEATIEELRRTHFMEDAVLVGFDWPALVRAKHVVPHLPCWFTTRRRRSRAEATWAGGFDPARFGGSIAEAIRSARGDGWLCSHTQVTPRAFDQARQCGLKFGVWTVNDRRDMRALAKLGVDAIISDRPDRLAALS